MTTAAPSAGLQSAIRRRIERPQASRTGSWLLGAAAATAVVALVVVASRTALGPAPERAQLSDIRLSPSAVVAPAVSGSVNDRTPFRDTSPATTRSRTRVRSAAAAAVPDPIVVEPIELELIEPPFLTVEAIAAPMPLDVQPLVIEPLSVQ